MTASEPQPAAPPHKLRWFQYRLRSLFLLTFLVAIACSWLAVRMEPARKQREAVEAIEKAGGYIRYDYQQFPGIHFSTPKQPSGPVWLRKLTGPDFFDKVVDVDFHDPRTNDAMLEPLEGLRDLEWLSIRGTREPYRSTVTVHITDAGLVHIKKLSGLKYLYLPGCQFTDAGLKCLDGLTRLQSLDLSNTRVTDMGLRHLKHLTQLQTLDLGGTRITGSGLEQLAGLTELNDLDLRNTAVSGEGLKWLQRLPLVELNLDGCAAVTDSGLKYLQPLSQLHSLWLNNTPVTNAGLKHLKGLRQLQWLDLVDTGVTDTGVEGSSRTDATSIAGPRRHENHGCSDRMPRRDEQTRISVPR